MRSRLENWRKFGWVLAVWSVSGGLFAAELAPVAETSAAQLKRASQMRVEAKNLRSEAGRIRERDDYDCKTNAFFVNSCLAKSRNRYIERITPARQLEIDANALEQKAKTQGKEEREAVNAANLPRPSAKPLPDASAPHTSHGPTGRPITSGENPPPKPTAKPINPAEQAVHEQQKQAEHTKEAQQAAQRAKKAVQDKADYEKRALEAQQRKAKQAQKQAAKNAANAAQSTPPATSE